VRRRDNLAVLERFSRPRHGTRLDRDDVLGQLRAARVEGTTALGVPEVDE